MAEQMQLFITLTIIGGARKKGQKVESRLQVASATTAPGIATSGTLLSHTRRSIIHGSHSQMAFLPPPAHSAELLRSTSVELIERWDMLYGAQHRKIHLGYVYIRDVLEIKVPNVQEQNERERREEEERNVRW